MLKGDEAALIMVAVAGCSLAEIAVAAEVSVSTVQRRLRDDDIRAGRTRRAHAAASRGGRSPQRGRAAGDRSTRSVRRRRQPADRLERDRHASGQRPQACGRRLRGTAQRSRAEATARKPAMRKWDARLESIESKRAGGRTAVWEGDGTEWQQSAYSVQLAAKLGLGGRSTTICSGAAPATPTARRSSGGRGHGRRHVKGDRPRTGRGLRADVDHIRPDCGPAQVVSPKRT